ncbi:MAG: plasmid pRiA4b ORF-3 family protein [Chitinophagaceae bacterium]
MQRKNQELIYQFYIELQVSQPLVWRRIVIPENHTMYDLHMAIQGAFGWENSHLFQFSENGLEDKTCYGMPYEGIDPEMVTIDARKIKINKVLKKDRQEYVYVCDFGDHWQHKIKLEKFLDKDNRVLSAFCIEGGGACPPEDVGGIHGYKEMLEVFKTPHHPEKASYIEWLGLVSGEKWNPELCSIREANKRLAMLVSEM